MLPDNAADDNADGCALTAGGVPPDPDAVQVHRRVLLRHLSQHRRVARAARAVLQIVLRAQPELPRAVAGTCSAK